MLCKDEGRLVLIHTQPASATNRQGDNGCRMTKVTIGNYWQVIQRGNLADERGKILTGHAAAY